MAGCADAPGNEREVYIVPSQDTLYSIAWRYGLDFHEIRRNGKPIDPLRFLSETK